MMKYKQQLTLEFTKAHTARVSRFLDTWSSHTYDEEWPDSIIVSNTGESSIEESISAIREQRRLPSGYSHFAGKSLIPARRAIELLDTIRSIIITNEDLLYISKNQFDALIRQLVDNQYLSSSQGEAYKLSIPAIYTKQDMRQDALANKDADLALRVAELYRAETEQDWEKDGSSYLEWLCIAKRFNPDHSFFVDPEKIAASLAGIKKANVCDLLVDPNYAWLLDIVATCSTLEILSFPSGYFFPKYHVNSKLVGLLAKNLSIKEVDMSASMHTDYNERMTTNEIKILANGLLLNQSIEKLNVADQRRMADEGLIFIVDALIANPKAKIKSLNIFGCNITPDGANYLLANLAKIPTLEWVNLCENRPGTEEIMRTINTILKARAEAVKVEHATAPAFDGTSMFLYSPKGSEAAPTVAVAEEAKITPR